MAMTEERLGKPVTEREKKPFTVVFVCTANICRSPMAEGILRHLVASDAFQGTIRVVSAGVAAIKGHKASVLAEVVSLDAGINISKHASQPVTRRLMKDAGLVLAMTPEQRSEMETLYPEFRGKIFLLREYGRTRRLGDGGAIEDPYGGDKEDYERCFMRLQTEIKRILPVLERTIHVE